MQGVGRNRFDLQVSEIGKRTPSVLMDSGSAANWPEHTSSLAKTCKKRDSHSIWQTSVNV